MKKLLLLFSLVFFFIGCPSNHLDIIDIKEKIDECKLACALESGLILEYQNERDSCIKSAWDNYQYWIWLCEQPTEEGFPQPDDLSQIELPDPLPLECLFNGWEQYNKNIVYCIETYDKKVNDLLDKMSRCRSNCIDNIFKLID